MPLKSTSGEAVGSIEKGGDIPMEHIIHIAVQDKIATKTDRTVYICGNSDFVIDFDFDEEWDDYPEKTARFKHNGEYADVEFSGSRCPVPRITNTYFFEVGVYAGDLRTTTPARVPAKKSILCGDDIPAVPPGGTDTPPAPPGGSTILPDGKAGQMLYFGTDGVLYPLTLGAGLKIVNGCLFVTATGEVIATFNVDGDGNATIDGATLTVDEDGNGTLSGATLTVDEDGSGTIA